jgi:hypothetical protein
VESELGTMGCGNKNLIEISPGWKPVLFNACGLRSNVQGVGGPHDQDRAELSLALNTTEQLRSPWASTSSVWLSVSVRTAS